MRFAELGEPAIPLRRVRPEAIPDLHLFLGAEPQGLAIGLVLMIAPVHAAVEPGAVPDAEHVAGLMHGDLQRPAQERQRLAPGVAHAVERPHADRLVERGLAEEEIPALPWPEVGRRQGQDGHGIPRPVLGQMIPDEARQELLLPEMGFPFAPIPGRSPNRSDQAIGPGGRKTA